jgi:pimeloyl-ACP methyl ester carboxylesterase
MLRSLAAALAVGLLSASCASVSTVPAAELVPPLGGAARSLALPGGSPFALRSGTVEGEHGCTLSYETYLPEPRRSDCMVMLAHGFMRDLGSMRGWAAHWASHGVAVTVVSFCNSRLTGGHHDWNADDLAAVARKIHSGPVMYAGFSAGALAAFLAAASDERAVAYLGLDAVDSGELASPASAAFRLPALFLLGEPSPCNAEANFVPAIPTGSGVAALRVAHATHCHFENPYDPRCECVCGRVEPAEAAERIVETIRSLATAWVVERTTGSQEAAGVLASALSGEGGWAGRAGAVQGGGR